MSRKICFVAMGFGKKMDYRNSKEVDLDIIYKKVIKNLFDSLTEYELIRADEISGSEIIDVSMYSLLLKADLVIADITTMNENAIYELGIRHASKPFSTIIMMQESEKIPFDLNHCRILTYKDFGEVLDDEEAEKIKTNLHSFIKASEEQNIDSPLYTYLPNIVPPNISDRELDELLDTAKTKEETISNLVGKAEALKNESKFKESISEWKKLRDILPNNDYIVQQLALVQYKSKYPNATLALGEALNTIQSLNPKKSLDLETIGITGAIYKNLFKLNKNYDYLDEAINYYKKGFMRNQRIIAGNAQFTGIAAGRGVGFTTGLLLLRKGLGMRETPIRPHSWHCRMQSGYQYGGNRKRPPVWRRHRGSLRPRGRNLGGVEGMTGGCGSGCDPAIHTRRLRVYHRPRRLRMASRISIFFAARRFEPLNSMG